MKKTIIFTPFDMTSHYLRCFQLADTIKDTYNIYFMSSQKYINLIKDKGYKPILYNPINSAKFIQMETHNDHSWMSYKTLKPICLEQIQILETYQPDIVINDFVITTPMSCEYCNIKCISLINAHLTKYYALQRDTKTNILNQLSKKIKIYKLCEKIHLPELIETIIFKLIHKEMNKLRKELNLPLKSGYLDEIESDYNLILDIPEIGPLKNMPPNYKYIGPLFHQYKKDEKTIINKLDPDKETIFITLGTGNNNQTFYKIFEDNLFRNYNIIIQNNSVTKTQIKNNIIYVNFINFEEFFQHINLIIFHGGDGTLYESIKHRIPSLIIPQLLEQYWSFQRIENFGFSELITSSNSQSIYEQISKLLKEKNNHNLQHLSKLINVKQTKQNFKNILNEILKNE